MLTIFFLSGFIPCFIIYSIFVSDTFGSKLKMTVDKVVNGNKLLFNFLLLIVILYILHLDFNLIYCDGDDKPTIVSVDNTTFNIFGLKGLADSFSTLSAFNAGMFTALKVVQKTPHPIMFKTMFCTVSGMSAVVAFNLTKKTMEESLPNVVNLNAEVEYLSTNKKSTATVDAILTEGNDFSADSPVEQGDSSVYTNILDILDNSLILSVLIVILIIMVIIFFTFKLISDMNITFPWIKKIYFGDRLHNFLIHLISLWGKTSFAWGYFGLLLILIFSIINTHALYVLYQNLHIILK